MTEFEKARAEFEKTFDYLNTIYSEDIHPKIREVELQKFPLSVKEHGGAEEV
mgnify:CR=1 FL=1